jgi:hypothetical protein
VLAANGIIREAKMPGDDRDEDQQFRRGILGWLLNPGVRPTKSTVLRSAREGATMSLAVRGGSVDSREKDCVIHAPASPSAPLAIWLSSGLVSGALGGHFADRLGRLPARDPFRNRRHHRGL